VRQCGCTALAVALRARVGANAQRWPAEIGAYVARVIASKASSSRVHFSTKSGLTCISVAKHEGKLSLGLTVDVSRHRNREAAIRDFFAHRRIVPGTDYFASNGGRAEATRVLDFPMTGDSGTVAEIASDLLREIYRLKGTTTLDVRFEER
jgi:hypothetical protein